MKKFPLFHKLIATSFGAGYSPVAPGTMGAVVAVAVWYVLWLNFTITKRKAFQFTQAMLTIHAR